MSKRQLPNLLCLNIRCIKCCLGFYYIILIQWWLTLVCWALLTNLRCLSQWLIVQNGILIRKFMQVLDFPYSQLWAFTKKLKNCNDWSESLKKLSDWFFQVRRKTSATLNIDAFIFGKDKTFGCWLSE